MTYMLYKNTFKKIRRSLGRYLSMFLIVLLGVGFMAGIQSSAPDINAVSDTYFKEQKLMDFRIVSTLGLTEEDVIALESLDYVKRAIPSYSLDLLAENKTLRVMALEDEVNTVKLVKGRMPQTEGEALGDSKSYRVGDTIAITSDVEDQLSNTLYTVVGTVESSLYLSKDYGSTTVGDGKLASFAFFPKSNFILEAYTDIYLVMDSSGEVESYGDAYEAEALALEELLVRLAPNQERARYTAILEEGNAKIDENETTLMDEKAEGEQKLADALTELEEASKELSDAQSKAEEEFANAKAELDKSVAELAQGKITADTEFATALEELQANSRKLEEGSASLLSEEAKLNAEVETQNTAFEEAKGQIAAGWTQMDSSLLQYGLAREDVDGKVEEANISVTHLEGQLALLTPDTSEYNTTQAALEQAKVIQAGFIQLQQSLSELAEKESELNLGIETFQATIEEARSQIASGKAELATSEKALADGYVQYETEKESYRLEMAENEKALADGYAEYESGLEQYEKEIAENQEKLAEGYQEYKDNLILFQEEIADAEQKIAEARQELLEIERPEWHIFSRDDVVGYSGLRAGTEVITKVANIFPLFFIAIVMLMTSNSMARMIVEERSELGTLTSLGYPSSSIIGTYLLYVLSASGLGAVIGFLGGSRIIPPLIYLTFQYILPPLEIHYKMLTFAIVMLVTVALMSGVTVSACRRELKERPATLMRPVPPQSGQTILLQRVGFLWNRLSFSWKVTMRNMFRYKKRALMTIIGVAGCASLLVTGFGLRDSMDGVAEKQYGELFRFESMIVLQKETDDMDSALKERLSTAGLEEPLLIHQSAYTVVADGRNMGAYLVVPELLPEFEDYYTLRDYKQGTPLSLGGDGVIITQKIADIFSLQVGNNVTIRDGSGNTCELKVKGVTENYTSNYIYMDPALYESTFGNVVSYNTVVANYTGEESAIGKSLINSDTALNIVFTKDLVQQILDSNESLNSIVVLIVVVASLLALIVLYNLTSINISERTREIATLKVLGFRSMETNAYIYREALVLTILSILVGMGLGVLLHGLVLALIESDEALFFRQIKWWSFAMSFGLTLLFSLIMQFITFFKLQTIDMVESLKSVE